MRRRRKSHTQFDEPSLVPLADMLTNTVGIMVFILIFTVLTAGGATVVKYLPFIREARLSDKRICFCAHNRLYPLLDETEKKVDDQLSEADKAYTSTYGAPLGTLGKRDYAQHIGTVRCDDQYLHISVSFSVKEDTGELERTIVFEPVEKNGISAHDIARPDGILASTLSHADSSDCAVLFAVQPDSIGVFAAARDFVAEQHFSSNWFPEDPGNAFVFKTSGTSERSGNIRIQ